MVDLIVFLGDSKIKNLHQRLLLYLLLHVHKERRHDVGRSILKVTAVCTEPIVNNLN